MSDRNPFDLIRHIATRNEAGVVAAVNDLFYGLKEVKHPIANYRFLYRNSYDKESERFESENESTFLMTIDDVLNIQQQVETDLIDISFNFEYRVLLPTAASPHQPISFEKLVENGMLGNDALLAYVQSLMLDIEENYVTETPEWNYLVPNHVIRGAPPKVMGGIRVVRKQKQSVAAINREIVNTLNLGKNNKEITDIIPPTKQEYSSGDHVRINAAFRVCNIKSHFIKKGLF